MRNQQRAPTAIVAPTEDPHTSRSLVPMLVTGLVLTTLGIVAAFLFS